jgi:hypothetical protein
MSPFLSTARKMRRPVSEFEIFRSKHNLTHYVAIVAGDNDANATGVRESQNLSPLTRIPDDGGARIAFDPTAAKAAIGDHGFYAFAVTVERREHFE